MTYCTTDFKTVAYLKYAGFDVVQVEKVQPGRTVRFHFTDTPELGDARLQFANGNPGDPGIRMLNAIESVKTMIHQ